MIKNRINKTILSLAVTGMIIGASGVQSLAFGKDNKWNEYKDKYYVEQYNDFDSIQLLYMTGLMTDLDDDEKELYDIRVCIDIEGSEFKNCTLTGKELTRFFDNQNRTNYNRGDLEGIDYVTARFGDVNEFYILKKKEWTDAEIVVAIEEMKHQLQGELNLSDPDAITRVNFVHLKNNFIFKKKGLKSVKVDYILEEEVDENFNILNLTSTKSKRLNGQLHFGEDGMVFESN